MPVSPTPPRTSAPALGLGRDARRIVVLGVAGSGKSTTARRISEALGIPWHRMDEINWRPGWDMLPPAAQRPVAERVCAEDAWVLDALYSGWAEVARPRIELYVGLDLPWRVSFGRLLRRTVARIRSGEPVCNGNRETWRRALATTDSILLWHARTFARKRRTIREAAHRPDGPPVLRFTRQGDLDAWIESLSAET